MTFSKFAIASAAATLIVSAPAFAQGTGTTYNDRSTGVPATTGQVPPSATGTPMKGSGTMMKSGESMTRSTPSSSSSENKPTATGGQPGGAVNRSN